MTEGCRPLAGRVLVRVNLLVGLGLATAESVVLVMSLAPEVQDHVHPVRLPNPLHPAGRSLVLILNLHCFLAETVSANLCRVEFERSVSDFLQTFLTMVFSMFATITDATRIFFLCPGVVSFLEPVWSSVAVVAVVAVIGRTFTFTLHCSAAISFTC